MMPYPHSHVTHCTRCQDPFHYDPDLFVTAPRVCEQCKLSRRAATADARAIQQWKAQQAYGARRKARAVKLGFTSAGMGQELKKLTIRTHAEVGAILGITAESCRQLERSALAKCRKAFKLDLLAQQLDNSLRTHE